MLACLLLVSDLGTTLFDVAVCYSSYQVRFCSLAASNALPIPWTGSKAHVNRLALLNDTNLEQGASPSKIFQIEQCIVGLVQLHPAYHLQSIWLTHPPTPWPSPSKLGIRHSGGIWIQRLQPNKRSWKGPNIFDAKRIYYSLDWNSYAQNQTNKTRPLSLLLALHRPLHFPKPTPPCSKLHHPLLSTKHSPFSEPKQNSIKGIGGYMAKSSRKA